MKRWHKALFCIVFSFIFCFLTVGYAAVSDTLVIEGISESKAQTGVFIKSATLANPSDNAEISRYYGTNLTSRVNLGNDGSATVTFNLSVYNNSAYVYTFNGVKYMVGEETYDNENITFLLSGLEKGNSIGGKETIHFSVTFKYDNANNIRDTELNSILNFEFVPEAEYIPEIVVSGALGKFEQILNDSADMTALLNQMDNYQDNRHNSSYIGNVVGSTSSDTALLNSLFTEDGTNYLTLEIGGVTTNVTAMIKRENVDGNAATGDENGNEMTIYMTADDISDLPWYGGSVEVFAAVFTKSDDGKWYQIGEMYDGTATANNYSGGWGRNSFNTDTWETTKAYYDGAAPRGSDIETVIAAIPKT